MFVKKSVQFFGGPHCGVAECTRPSPKFEDPQFADNEKKIVVIYRAVWGHFHVSIRNRSAFGNNEAPDFRRVTVTVHNQNLKPNSVIQAKSVHKYIYDKDKKNEKDLLNKQLNDSYLYHALRLQSTSLMRIKTRLVHRNVEQPCQQQFSNIRQLEWVTYFIQRSQWTAGYTQRQFDREYGILSQSNYIAFHD